MAADVFCDYTATITIRNDQNGGRMLTSFWLGMLFEPGTVVNGTVSTGVTFTDSNIANIPADTEATETTTARANRAPGYYDMWMAFDLSLPEGSQVVNVTIVTPAALAVTNCSEDAGKHTPGVQTGGFPALIVPQLTENGPEWSIWDFSPESGGFETLIVTQELIASFPAKPAANTVIASSKDSRVRFSILTTGEYQINYGPDIEGKESVVIFDAAGNFRGKYEFNLYQLGN